MFKAVLRGALVASAILVSPTAFPQGQLHQAQLVDQHISSLMRSAEVTTRAIGEALKVNARDDLSFHKLLNEYLPDMPEVRAIIVLDANGKIVHDSFRHPAVPLDLSERDYFREAKKMRGRKLFIGRVEKGKTSGLPFLPVSRGVFDGDKFLGVVSLVITPGNLLRHGQWRACQHCYVEVLRGDLNMLAQHPPNVDRPDGYFDDIQLDENSASGHVRGVAFHEVKADVSWIRNEQYPLITVYMDVKPGSIIELN